MILDVISRFVHIATAITLVGGSVFTWLVLMPAVKAISDEAHQTLAAAVVARWKRIVHVGILLFLVSGFYNFFRALDSHQGDSLYNALLGTKILLAFVVFFIASALVGRSPKLEPMRQAKAKWLAVMILLATVIVGISGYVKVRGPVSGPNEASNTE